MIVATYVRDIDASRAFYELLGFTEKRSGASPDSAWSELSGAGHLILLVATDPPLAVPRLPLLFYFFVAHLEAQLASLAAAGVTSGYLGQPPHAPGGEAKLTDPDGNTVLIGQRVAAAAGTSPDPDGTTRFSLLSQAAAAVAARGKPGVRCQVSGEQWVPCGQIAEVRIADSAGDTVWVCLVHADEILLSVPGAFITSPEERGIAAFLAGRHR
jgi:catechol 2,3-dioxygenase-like lactoylglutathione lyase family enzyme